MTSFCRKVSFWGPYWPLNYFSRAPLNLSRQDASFKYTYDYILNHNFFDQKSGKIGRNSKISPLSSWSLIFAWGFIFSFFDMVNIQKVSILPLFVGVFLMKKYIWPPLVGTGKNYSYLVLQRIKKCYQKMSLVFLIIKKTSKWGRNGMKQMYK